MKIQGNKIQALPINRRNRTMRNLMEAKSIEYQKDIDKDPSSWRAFVCQDSTYKDLTSDISDEFGLSYQAEPTRRKIAFKRVKAPFVANTVWNSQRTSPKNRRESGSWRHNSMQ